MTPLVKLTATYAMFAGIATATNLISQWLTLRLWTALDGPPNYAVWIALVCGTGVGLIVKYVLDKTYIFNDRSSGVRVHAVKFSLYSTMGIGTTLIFWVAELISNQIDPRGPLIYFGGAVGLAIGYIVKYQLDRRFVFKSRQPPSTVPE